ncbi:MAG: hypothetical protein Q8R83_08255 [Legionellaceae bacterium]|nr:hypothetical protein [Legionellaceae bacterium]
MYSKNQRTSSLLFQYGVSNNSGNRSPRKAQHISLMLNLGRNKKNNPVFPINLNLLVSSDDLKEVVAIIREIEAIDLNVDLLQSEHLNQLTNLVLRLAALPCMIENELARSSILSAPAEYFRAVIESMGSATNTILPGHPGFNAYNNRLRQLDYYIRQVDNVLLKEKLITPEMNLSLIAPTDMTFESFESLPSSLMDFVSSIEVNQSCIAEWEGRFDFYADNHEQLSDYFLLIEGFIRQLSPIESFSAPFIIDKIQRFASALSRHAPHRSLEIAMLNDVAIDAVTPKPVPTFKSKSPRAIVPSQTTKTYTTDLRELLSFLKSITTLEQFKQVFHDNENSHSVRNKIVIILNKNKTNEDKKAFLIELKQQINSELECKVFTPFLSQYLDHCLGRIKDPLSPELLDRYHSLQQVYEPPLFPRDFKKDLFLKTWLDMITTNPALSYSECHDLAEAGSASGVDIKRHWFDLFDPRRHRCRQLMQDIIEPEDSAIYNP